MPALRQRQEDIPALAEIFLSDLSQQLGRGGLELSDEARNALTDYDWPGNVRELRNVLERAALLAEDNVLRLRDLRFQQVLDTESSNGHFLTLEAMEIRHIERALRLEEGQVARAAERLGIPRSTLYQKIKRYQITH